MRHLLALALLLIPAASTACGIEDSCPLDGRGYRVAAPADWDGITPLPVVLHFHGWGRQGVVPLRSPRTGQAARAAGALFVAPDGLFNTWSFRTAGSPDSTFADAILRDVADRYPTDGRLIVSGYSWGALMAARFACDTETAIEALLLIAGAFRPTIDCALPTPPRRVSHTHGLTDGVLDFPYGPDGSDTYAVALWRDRLGCKTTPERQFDWQAVSWLTHTRHEWDCMEGRVTMDVHSASHLIPRGWMARHLSEILD